MNNSKQTVLSIVGIAILVIAVVGVSFAFFTYSRQGGTNNVITTGSITFVSNNDTATALALTNEFPQAANYDALSDSNRDAFEFHVNGTVPSTANDIYYGVYVVEGDAAGAANTDVSDLDANTYTTRFQPEDISVAVSNDAAAGTGGVVPSYNTGAPLTSAVTGTGDLVAYGTVAKGSSNLTHNLRLKMYVNSSVGISDTTNANNNGGPNYKYRAHAQSQDWPDTPSGVSTDTRPVYSSLYYTIKVRVDARDTEPYYTPSNS